MSGLLPPWPLEVVGPVITFLTIAPMAWLLWDAIVTPETMSLEILLRAYRDGDEHGWDTEFDYLRREHASQLQELSDDVAEWGIQSPILLGSDGRIWDGHHRLCVAHDLGLKSVPIRRATQ